MALISLKFTPRELSLLSTLASDQMFRREFIDPRIPGHQADPAEMIMGKKLVERLRGQADRVRNLSAPKRKAISL